MRDWYHHIRSKTQTQTKTPKFLQLAVLCAAVVEPLMTLPQIYEIWIRHQTAGVSLATWTFYSLGATIWLAYGLTIRNRPLIISGVLWVTLQWSVVLGLLVQ